MKTNNGIKLFFLLILGMIIVFTSCEYETIVRDTEYPDQKIYLPSSSYQNGFFVIDDISRVIGSLPFEGNPYKYIIDTINRNFQIPLSVYRAGINNNGEFDVNININTDTINSVNLLGIYDSVLVPIQPTAYSLVDKLIMKDGEGISKFNLNVDLDYLLNNYPNKSFALGVNISSDTREVNSELSTTIVIIDTKIMKPTADFSFTIRNFAATFNNNSLMAEKYEWDFGDNSENSTEMIPKHDYASPGTYTVSLTAIGITGRTEKSVLTKDITIQ